MAKESDRLRVQFAIDDAQGRTIGIARRTFGAYDDAGDRTAHDLFPTTDADGKVNSKTPARRFAVWHDDSGVPPAQRRELLLEWNHALRALYRAAGVVVVIHRVSVHDTSLRDLHRLDEHRVTAQQLSAIEARLETSIRRRQKHIVSLAAGDGLLANQLLSLYGDSDVRNLHTRLISEHQDSLHRLFAMNSLRGRPGAPSIVELARAGYTHGANTWIGMEVIGDERWEAVERLDYVWPAPAR